LGIGLYLQKENGKNHNRMLNEKKIDSLIHFCPVVILLISSCSDEFDIRKHIDGRWSIESIRFQPATPNSLLPKDSLLVSPGAFIEFFGCSRRQNQSSQCDASASILGLDLQLTYNIREDRVAFGVAADRIDDHRKIPLEEMLIIGPEHFQVTGVRTNEMLFRKQGLINLPASPLQPAVIEIRLSRSE
jgi:hypothetical protein